MLLDKRAIRSRATSFAACSLLTLGIDETSKGRSIASGSLMYETNLDSRAEREKIDSEENQVSSVSQPNTMACSTFFDVYCSKWGLFIHLEIHGGAITNFVIYIIQTSRKPQDRVLWQYT